MRIEAGASGIGKLTLDTGFELDAALVASGVDPETARAILVSLLGPSFERYLKYAQAVCLAVNQDTARVHDVMSRVELQLDVAIAELRQGI